MSSFLITQFSEGRLAGSSIFARPGHFSFEHSIATVFAVALMVLGSNTASLGNASVTSLASVLLLVVGLPHGALDIATIRRAAPSAQLAVVGSYLGAAAAMFSVWWISPLAGLAVFYLFSIAHFAHDWDEAQQPFFAHAIAVALLSAPALSHAIALKGLFVALTGDPRATLLVDVLILIAPVATIVALVGLATMDAAQRKVEGICALAAMFVLPPVIGFAVFFCLFHSPRHFREGWAALGPNVLPSISVRVAAMTVAGFGIAALIYAATGSLNIPSSLFVTGMMTLSVLTVPHMLLANIINRMGGSAV